MKSILTVLSVIFILIALVCTGCEPEPQAAPAAEVITEEVEPAEPEIQEMVLVESEEAAEETAEDAPEMSEEAKMLLEELEKRAKEAEEAEQALVEEEVVTAEPKTAPGQETVTEEIAKPAKETPAEATVEKEQTKTEAVGYAFKINGVEFSEAQVEEFAKPSLEMLNKQYAGREPDDRYNMAIKNIKLRSADAVITRALVEEKMTEENIVVTEDDIVQFISDIAASENMTVEELKTVISRGSDFEEWKKQMQLDIRKAVAKIVEKQDPESFAVTDEEVEGFYKKNERRYNTPEQVKASHILIKPEGGNTETNDADANARSKAEELLDQIKAGADFAELAKENSACPSSSNGGDLGFGAKTTWVPPFSEAAFALEIGEVSDVVKTRFGYHIIKATDKKPAEVTTLDDVKESIKLKLRLQKEMQQGGQYITNLKKEAQMEFSEDYKELSRIQK